MATGSGSTTVLLDEDQNLHPVNEFAITMTITIGYPSIKQSYTA